MSNEFVFTIHLSNTRSKCKKVVTDTNLFPFCGSWSLLHKARASCQVKQSLVATEMSTISLLTTNYSLFRPITPVFIIYRNLFFTLSSHNNLQHVQKLKKKINKISEGSVEIFQSTFTVKFKKLKFSNNFNRIVNSILLLQVLQPTKGYNSPIE